MSITAFKGPLIVPLNDAAVAAGAAAQTYNPDAGPSLFGSGFALLDPRWGYRGGGGQAGFGNNAYLGLGWMACGDVELINATPSAIAANNMAASQAPTAGVALTLVAATGAGITVLPAATLLYPALNTAPANALAVDGAPGLVAFGQSGAVALYDPTKALARNVRITSAGNDSAATFTVAGYDLYGYAQTEAITGANTGIASGKKAFKIITSITPSGTLSGSNVQAGTGDVYGLPLRADDWGHVTVVWNNAFITANTGFVVADTTSPATTTTGDVRGTYAVQSASDGTKTMQVYVTPKVGNIGSALGLTGVAPV